MTSPHIGNYGVNEEDAESRKPFGAGLIVREISGLYSNWRARESLQAYMQRFGLMGLTDVDTRALTKHLRDTGSLRGVISTRDLDPKSLIAKAKASPNMNGADLARVVTCEKPYQWLREGGRWVRKNIEEAPALISGERYRVVVMDFGVKFNTLRNLVLKGCQVLVVPGGSSAKAILEFKPHGIMVSNGPGDPAAVTYAVLRRLSNSSRPWASLQFKRTIY